MIHGASSHLPPCQRSTGRVGVVMAAIWFMGSADIPHLRLGWLETTRTRLRDANLEMGNICVCRSEPVSFPMNHFHPFRILGIWSVCRRQQFCKTLSHARHLLRTTLLFSGVFRTDDLHARSKGARGLSGLPSRLYFVDHLEFCNNHPDRFASGIGAVNAPSIGLHKVVGERSLIQHRASVDIGADGLLG